MLKSICMDLDGVLVEAVIWHYQAFNRALKEVCGFELNETEHTADFNGLPTKKKLEMLLDQGKINANQVSEIWNLKQEYTKATILEFAKPDPIKIEMHQYLKSKNFFLACVTNSIEETARLMLEKTGQLEYLDLLISNDMVQNPKPHPEGYIKAMVKFGTLPDETLIIEDSPKGLQAAYATGAMVWKVKDSTEVTLENIRRILT